MPETMKFVLVSPRGVLASSEAEAIDLPVTEGDMTAMRHHAALIGTLKPGIIRASHAGKVDEFVVIGGFVEVNEDETTVLAEQAIKRGDVTADTFDAWLEKAEEQVSYLEGAKRDIAETRLAGMKTLRLELNV